MEKDEVTLQVQARAKGLLENVTSNVDKIDGIALIAQLKDSESSFSVFNSVLANSRQARLNIALSMVDFIESVFKQDEYLKYNGDISIVDTLRTYLDKAEHFDEFVDFASKEYGLGIDIEADLKNTLSQDHSFVKLFEEYYEEAKNGQ